MSDDINNPNDVFKAAVKKRLEMHPNQWTGDDSVDVNLALIANLRDKDGKALDLTPHEKDVIQLASRPTHEVQVRVIRTIIENHAAKIDVVTDRHFRKVVAAPAFKLDLIKAGYIKDTETGGLKDLLD